VLDDGQLRALDRYAELLTTKGRSLGLLSAADVPKVWERHIFDGLRGAAFIPDHARMTVDLGSGGGVPGVLVSIARPDVTVVLAEERRGRAAFLELVVEVLGLTNAGVSFGPVQRLDGPFDVAFARAFADPLTSWEMAARLLGPSGTLLYWAGVSLDVSQIAGIDHQIHPASPALADAGPIVIMSRQ